MKRALTRWKKQEAAEVIRRSRTVLKTPYIDIRKAHKQGVNARILIVTPRKSGNAVHRNLFRRRLYSWFYENQLNKGDYDWIFFAKPGISCLTYDDIIALYAQALALSSSNSSSAVL